MRHSHHSHIVIPGQLRRRPLRRSQRRHDRSLFGRLCWLVFVGSWLAPATVVLAYALCLTGIGFQAGLDLLTILPALATGSHRKASHPLGMYGRYERTRHFLIIGWWLTPLTVIAAIVLGVTIIGLPLSFYLATYLDRIAVNAD